LFPLKCPKTTDRSRSQGKQVSWGLEVPGGFGDREKEGEGTKKQGEKMSGVFLMENKGEEKVPCKTKWSQDSR